MGMSAVAWFILMLGGSVVHSYNVLIFHDHGTKSHLQLYFPIVNQLLSRGHKVTGIYYGASGIKHENLTEVVLPDVLGAHMKDMSSIYMESQSSFLGLAHPKFTQTLTDLYNVHIVQFVIDVLQKKEVKFFLQQTYDVVLSSSPIAGVASHLTNSPLIILSPPGPMPIFMEASRNPIYPSLYPVFTSQFDKPESFRQRLMNMMRLFGMNMFYDNFLRVVESRLESELGYTGPRVMESLTRRIQLILSNSHSVTNDPQPLLENVVQVGGLHTREPRPLPTDLQNFLDSHPEGVVLVSFGSSITPSSMSLEKRKEFLQAFKLLNLPVIWKWDSNRTEDIPNNVLVRDWLPQQNILAHRNLKVFVTHGGLLSLMEAIYHETLIVGIPLANDQVHNLVRMSDKKVCVKLEYGEVTAESLADAVTQALNDKEMAASISTLSRRFKDTMEDPMDKAIWWIEYVIRNNGTEFLKPLSMNLSWYQAWNIDIFSAVLLIFFIILYVNFKIIKSCYSCCCSKRKTKLE